MRKQRSDLGELSHNWKGDDASYWAIHMWMNKHHTKTGLCEDCNQKGKTQWANLSGDYRRDDITDWKELCASCHKKLDMTQTLSPEHLQLRSLTKECQVCKAVMIKNSEWSYKDWAKQKFCSTQCRNAGYQKLKRQTHCKRNHEFTPENTYIDPKGAQQCRTCINARLRARRAKLKEVKV